MTQESTLFKNFTGWSEFDRATRNVSIYVKVHGVGFFTPVTKKAIKKVYESMSTNGFKLNFQGKITYVQSGKAAQVEFEQL